MAMLCSTRWSSAAFRQPDPVHQVNQTTKNILVVPGATFWYNATRLICQECNNATMGYCVGARFSTEVSSSSSAPLSPDNGQVPKPTKSTVAGRKNGRGVAELHRAARPSLQ
jgi:hypothetical protein